MTTVRCAFRNVQTGERVCLRTDRHDCEVRAARLANRCTITSPHTCTLGAHRMASRPSRIRLPWRRVSA